MPTIPNAYYAYKKCLFDILLMPDMALFYQSAANHSFKF